MSDARFDAANTAPPARSDEQFTAFAPTSAADILSPRASRALCAWISRERRDMLAAREDPVDAARRNRALVLTQSDFRAAARCVTWVVRVVPPRCVASSSSVRPLLSADAFALAGGPDFPDHAPLHAVRHGVSFPVDPSSPRSFSGTRQHLAHGGGWHAVHP